MSEFLRIPAKLAPSQRWCSLVQYYAQRVELPAEMIWAQMMAESAGNPDAISPCGAVGLMQLMSGAAGEVHVQNRNNPDQNLRGGTEYLARQLANVKLEVGPHPVLPDCLYRLALVSYNAGFGYTRAALRTMKDRGLPLDWPTFVKVFPDSTVNGRHPDWKQAISYAEKIVPPGG